MERERRAAHRSHLRRVEFLPDRGGTRPGPRGYAGRTGIQRRRIALPARQLMKTGTLLAAIGIAIACDAAAQSQKCKMARIAEWPVRAEQQHPVVDGAINAPKIGILLDTGAAQSLIRRSATGRLGLT